MCPESIPRIWLHPPAVAVGNTFQIGNHLPVSRLCSLGGCLLSFFPLAPVPLSTCFCSFVLLSSVLLSFSLPFPFPFFLFFCPFVFLSHFFFFCSSVLPSPSPLVPYTTLPARSCPAVVPLPFPPALYNIIRCSPRRRAFCVFDSCQERRKVHDFCKIICRKVCRFRGKLYLCTRFRPEPGCEQQGKSSLKGLHETVE